MQIHYLPRNMYKLASYSLRQENLSETAKVRKKLLGDWEILKQNKVQDKEIAKITGISRSTYYRRKKAISIFGTNALEYKSRVPHRKRQSQISQTTIDLILDIRKNNPTYGKAKIAVILKRDHDVLISESSVGRVLKKLIEQNKIQISPSYVRAKRKRKFKRHAQRWQYGMKAKTRGELIQIDHMTGTKNGVTYKHFQAWDPITKTIVAQVVSNATSAAAAKFLHKVRKDMPFDIKSVQVDGGSEFMKHFEDQCQKLDIPLHVLPPRRPQYNGGVERGNRIFKEEFYSLKDILADSIRHLNALLQNAVHKYNNFRPHFSLKGLTPCEYNNNLNLEIS